MTKKCLWHLFLRIEDRAKQTSDSHKSLLKWIRQGGNHNCFLCCSQLFITAWKGPQIIGETSDINYYQPRCSFHLSKTLIPEAQEVANSSFTCFLLFSLLFLWYQKTMLDNKVSSATTVLYSTLNKRMQDFYSFDSIQ